MVKLAIESDELHSSSDELQISEFTANLDRVFLLLCGLLHLFGSATVTV